MNGFKVISWYMRPIFLDNYKYEPGKLFTEDEAPSTGARGFHFTTALWRVYTTVSEYCWRRVFHVTAVGIVDEAMDIYSTNGILFGAEMQPDEIIRQMLEEYGKLPVNDANQSRVAVRVYLRGLWRSANASDDDMSRNLRYGARLGEATHDWRRQWRDAFLKLAENNELLQLTVKGPLGEWTP